MAAVLTSYPPSTSHHGYNTRGRSSLLAAPQPPAPPPSPLQSVRPPPSSQQQQQQDDLDDDLMASLASDTFSLESNRDRDLLLLSSFLQTALPPPNPSLHPASAHAHPSSQAQAQWMQSPPNTSTSHTSWNGWRPDATPSVPYNSFNNTSSSFSMMAAPPPPQTPMGTPHFSSHLPLPPESPLESPPGSRYGAMACSSPGSGGGGKGTRAPAVSRERTLSDLSHVQQFGGAPQWGVAEVDEDDSEDSMMMVE